MAGQNVATFAKSYYYVRNKGEKKDEKLYCL